MGQHREREISFEVDERWVMPDLDAVAPQEGRVVADQADLHATYFDTDDQVLRRLGVTLRRRTGGGDAGWHLKIPSGSARLEVQSKSRGRWIPATLADPLRGVLADRPLRQLATIDTDRRTMSVHDAEDQLVAEIADDRVSASGHDGAADSGPVRRWREIEVELGPGGSEEVLRLMTKRLTRSGARVSATQVKLDRALGPVNQQADGAPSALVANYLRTQVGEVLRADIGLRMGSDPEPVHDLRVASRRIRSIVREYRAVLADPAEETSSELRWLGEILGGIRDLDVLAETVKADIASLPAELVLGPVVTDLEEAVAKDRAAAVERWHQERDGDRYRQLMARLVEWLDAPPVLDHAKPRIQRVLEKASKRSRRRVSVAGADPEALHRARTATKRLRYAAELASPDQRSAARTAKKAKKVQRLLGAHQDQMVAQTYLRGLGARYGDTPGHNGYTFGLLTARADRHAAELRRTLRKH